MSKRELTSQHPNAVRWTVKPVPNVLLWSSLLKYIAQVARGRPFTRPMSVQGSHLHFFLSRRGMETCSKAFWVVKHCYLRSRSVKDQASQFCVTFLDSVCWIDAICGSHPDHFFKWLTCHWSRNCGESLDERFLAWRNLGCKIRFTIALSWVVNFKQSGTK